MENEILKTISKCSPYSFDSIKNAYDQLDKSFDNLIISINLATSQGLDLTFTAFSIKRTLPKSEAPKCQP